MKDILAERLLAEVMKWEPADVAQERPVLQALAAVKYDEYQQFSPGMKFVENLARWLRQFRSDEDRKRAYEFVRRRLIFISEEEMAHLVSVAFPDVIRPILVRQVAEELSIPHWCVSKIASSMEFQARLRQSLFLGLSDGARIGLFRRCNPIISNEQIRQEHEITPDRAEEMLKSLRARLAQIQSGDEAESGAMFRTIFLLDDFAGSGLTSLRREESHSAYAGKIWKAFPGQVFAESSPHRLVDVSDVTVCIVFYLATARALTHIRALMSDYLAGLRINPAWRVEAVQILPDEVCLSDQKDADIIDLLKQYYDALIVTESFRKGRNERPYLGFDECGLPLVLSHNTPNNSIPLLWYEEGGQFRGLFPRVSRTRE
jgi:hypothetical protein